MKPRPPTEEDVEFWNRNEDGITYIIGPMIGRHLGAEDIEVLLGYRVSVLELVKVPWVLDERDDPSQRQSFHELTVWTTFWGGMPATDVVVL